MGRWSGKRADEVPLPDELRSELHDWTDCQNRPSRKLPERRTHPNNRIRQVDHSVREDGEPCRIRTCDPLIKSQLLYQLS